MTIDRWIEIKTGLMEIYNETCDAYEKKIEEAKANNDWDFVKRLMEHKKNNCKCPLVDGERILLYSWDSERKDLIVDDNLWTKDIPSFVEAARLAEVETFLLTDSSTALMEEIHEFNRLGCALIAPDTYKVKDWDGSDVDKLGLRFSL